MKIYSVCMLFFISVFVLGQLQPGRNSFNIGSRNFDVFTPLDYDNSRTYPIVFELHGMGFNKEDMHDQEVVNQEQYIAVYPEGSRPRPTLNLLFGSFFKGRIWNTWSQTKIAVGNRNDVNYLTDVYNKVKEIIGASFDESQVYGYGFSNGGAMVMKMAQETNLFKAITIRSMTLLKGDNIRANTTRIPVLFVFGREDNIVPYYGGEGFYGYISPDFMPIKETVEKWATYNGCNLVPQEAHFYKDGDVGEYWFREYYNSQYKAPVYFYVVPGAGHFVFESNDNSLFTNFTDGNIKKTALRMFRNPTCYGFSRKLDKCLQ